ncbi:hypothetical protein Taro_039347 [Colocasia esculenta]|uniref:Uncharacterized protein n=1 Tax=Colocasia esculenta TaxID=4460 RepID=A0A843WFI9_COLES|nr:hypothetical protein [Colocasia esculenta]
MSLGVRIRVSSSAPAPQGPVLPPPPPVDYGVFMQGLVQAMQTQAHTQATLQAQLEAQALSAACRQEGEMEQYLEEKKASQKRLAAPFQRQDKKKVAFQSPQRPVASGSSQVPSQRSPSGQKECPHCGKAHDGTECWKLAGNAGAASIGSRIAPNCSREVSVERHQPQQQQQQRQRQDDQGDLEPQLECLR